MEDLAADDRMLKWNLKKRGLDELDWIKLAKNKEK